MMIELPAQLRSPDAGRLGKPQRKPARPAPVDALSATAADAPPQDRVAVEDDFWQGPSLSELVRRHGPQKDPRLFAADLWPEGEGEEFDQAFAQWRAGP